MVSIQNSYSLLVRVPFETDLAETCHHAEVSLLAYSPLNSFIIYFLFALGAFIVVGYIFNLFQGLRGSAAIPFYSYLTSNAVADYQLKANIG